jgi:hypothetical protein
VASRTLTDPEPSSLTKARGPWGRGAAGGVADADAVGPGVEAVLAAAVPVVTVVVDGASLRRLHAGVRARRNSGTKGRRVIGAGSLPTTAAPTALR